jgi:hypothetical protein
MPEIGPKLDAEMRRRIQKLPEAMWCDHMYQNRQFWYDFLTWEHTADGGPPSTVSTSRGRPSPSRTSPDKEDEEEDDDHDDFDVVKEDADQAMAAAVPPGAGDLPPEYQAVVAAGYDEEPSCSRSWRHPRPTKTRSSLSTATPLPSRAWWQSTWHLCHLHHHYHCMCSR